MCVGLLPLVKNLLSPTLAPGRTLNPPRSTPLNARLALDDAPPLSLAVEDEAPEDAADAAAAACVAILEFPATIQLHWG